MLAYAASRPATVERRPHPNAMLAIIAVHVAVVAVVMSAKMDLPIRLFPKPTTLIYVPTAKPPPPNDPQPHHDTQLQARNDTVDQPPVHVITPTHPSDTFGPPIKV